MKVIAVQYDFAWEDRPANFDTVRRLLTAAGVEPGSLIVLPEMFSTGFSMDVDTVAESKKSGTEKFLATLAWQYQSHVVGGLVSKDTSSGKGRNELAVYDPAGRPVSLYQKNYTFSYTSESDYYQAGESLGLFKWHDFMVCPLICYDLTARLSFFKPVFLEAGAPGLVGVQVSLRISVGRGFYGPSWSRRLRAVAARR